MRNRRLAILAVAAVLPLGGASLLVAGPASAAPPPPVTVSGTVEDCDSGSSPEDVTIETSKESKSKDVSGTNKYSVVFKNIPKNGRAGTATVTCEDGTSYDQKVKIKGSQNAQPAKQKINLEP
ncbi:MULTISPECIES: hypothetical protein [Streptomyces]|uniref:hypothetical protein n=1 Tax=Streptomyces TaxID=1883 RepID=UPI001587D308|nr:hypothetical protein [Streptomyces sp. CAI-85]NUV62174.1 hypothetical protein [Streptomyces sp. CAI-85]